MRPEGRGGGGGGSGAGISLAALWDEEENEEELTLEVFDNSSVQVRWGGKLGYLLMCTTTVLVLRSIMPGCIVA